MKRKIKFKLKKKKNIPVEVLGRIKYVKSYYVAYYRNLGNKIKKIKYKYRKHIHKFN